MSKPSRTDDVYQRFLEVPQYKVAEIIQGRLVTLAKTLEVFELAAQRWRLLATYRDDSAIRAAPFDAVELELGVLWMR